MIKLVIFDFDGVLAHIKDVHFWELNRALEYYGYNKISYDEHIVCFDGLPTKVKLKKLLQQGRIRELDINKIFAKKQENTKLALSSMEVDVNYKLIEFLKKLRSKNIRLAVASNAVYDTVMLYLKKAGLSEYFDKIIGNDCVKYVKPHPYMYMKLMLDFGVTPKETMIIEDSPKGTIGAYKSGAHVLVYDKEDDLIEVIDNMIHKINTTNSIFLSGSYVVPKSKNLTVIVPMAGEGRRFRDAGYELPKPLIPINDLPMIVWSVKSLNIEGAKYVFLCLKEHMDKYYIHNMLRYFFPQCTVVPVDKKTEGAACTVMLAEPFVNGSDEVLTANSDQIIRWNPHEFFYKIYNVMMDGCILTFKNNHPKWSYALCDDIGRVKRVAEKDPISDNATVGVYYWRSMKILSDSINSMINKNVRVNGEFYLCPAYNEAIAMKYNVYKHEIPDSNMIGLGTPEDLESFIKVSDNYERPV